MRDPIFQISEVQCIVQTGPGRPDSKNLEVVEKARCSNVVGWVGHSHLMILMASEFLPEHSKPLKMTKRFVMFSLESTLLLPYVAGIPSLAGGWTIFGWFPQLPFQGVQQILAGG